MAALPWSAGCEMQMWSFLRSMSIDTTASERTSSSVIIRVSKSPRKTTFCLKSLEYVTNDSKPAPPAAPDASLSPEA